MPSKRSRTPEQEEENNREKRLKLGHTAVNMDQGILGAGAGIDDELADSAMPDWDLEAQLQTILASVPEPAEDGAKAAAVNDSNFSLPPPLPRHEKMKYIENPTYFARAMGLPTLGSLVSRAAK